MGKEKWNNLLLILAAAVVVVGIPYFIYWLGSLIRIDYFGYINNWWIVLGFAILLVTFFILAGISLDKKMGAFFLILFLVSFFLLGIQFGERLEVDMMTYRSWQEKDAELQKQDSLLAALENNYFSLEEQWMSKQAGNSPIKNFEVVFFQPGKTEMTTFDQNRISKYISSLENCTLVVNGYTDDSGDESFNLNISKERAQNVAEFIQSIDQRSNHIQSVNGLGSQEPFANNTSELNRSKNRRVTIEVIDRQDVELLSEKQKIKAQIDALTSERMQTKTEKDSLWQVVFQ